MTEENWRDKVGEFRTKMSAFIDQPLQLESPADPAIKPNGKIQRKERIHAENGYDLLKKLHYQHEVEANRASNFTNDSDSDPDPIRTRQRFVAMHAREYLEKTDGPEAWREGFDILNAPQHHDLSLAYFLAEASISLPINSPKGTETVGDIIDLLYLNLHCLHFQCRALAREHELNQEELLREEKSQFSLKKNKKGKNRISATTNLTERYNAMADGFKNILKNWDKVNDARRVKFNDTDTGIVHHLSQCCDDSITAIETYCEFLRDEKDNGLSLRRLPLEGQERIHMNISIEKLEDMAAGAALIKKQLREAGIPAKPRTPPHFRQ